VGSSPVTANTEEKETYNFPSSTITGDDDEI
jgi:hypothetical protein